MDRQGGQKFNIIALIVSVLIADGRIPIHNHFTTILMEIIEKIQLTFEDVDEERLVSIARTCSELEDLEREVSA